MNFENDNVSYYANKMHSENNYSVCSSYGQNYIVVTQTPAPLSFVRVKSQILTYSYATVEFLHMTVLEWDSFGQPLCRGIDLVSPSRHLVLFYMKSNGNILSVISSTKAPNESCSIWVSVLMSQT